MGNLHRSPFPSGHHDHSPAGWPRDGRRTVPALTIPFDAPVHFRVILGLHAFTDELEAPAIYWGRSGCSFAPLFELVEVVGSCDQLPKRQRAVLAAVVAALLLRPIESAAPAAAPNLIH